MTDDRAAEAIAKEIYARRKGLDGEDRLAAGEALKSYARARKWRDLDRAQVNGMVIALTYVLDRPLDMVRAEDYIAEIHLREAT